MFNLQDEVTKTLREVLLMLRVKAKVSQVVPGKIGISRQTYTSIEIGK